MSSSTPDTDELICSCQESLPPLAAKGVELFAAGDYFEAHEELELAWRAETRMVRNLYQGILQIGVAYYHILHNNYRGARKMFQRGRASLEGLPEQCQGVDLVQFHRDFGAIETLILRLGPAHLPSFDKTMLKPVPLISNVGDENDH